MDGPSTHYPYPSLASPLRSKGLRDMFSKYRDIHIYFGLDLGLPYTSSVSWC